MLDQFSRTALLIGAGNIETLLSRRVAVFGVGGVGGHCADALCRAGIGAIDLFDGDIVDITNINRQLIATHKTVGRDKVDVMKEHLLEINPDVRVMASKMFYLPETAEKVDLSAYDYVVDAVDTMTAKLELVCRATALNVPVISSMGAANKLDPTAFAVADIYETTVCPMARIMRRELKKRGVGALKVVYSKEPPIKPTMASASYPTMTLATHHAENPVTSPDADFRLPTNPDSGSQTPERPVPRQIPASIAFVPPVAGLIMAAEVVKHFLIM